MPDAPPRTCEELISNEGTMLRALANRIEQPCGWDAIGYCNDDAKYLCDIHWDAKHHDHDVARR
jgi:hypothetical protein